MKKNSVSLEKYFVGLSKDSIIYGLGNTIIKILALITAPIFTRVFVPADYGIISLINSVISFLSLFLLFGMDAAVFVSFYQYKKEKREIVSSAFWFLFSWGLVLVIISSLFSGTFSNLVFKTSAYKILFLITILTAFLNLLINLVKLIYRLEFKVKTFVFIASANAILTTALMIFFVVYLKRGLAGYFEGQLIGTFLTLLAAIWLVKGYLKFNILPKRLKEMIFYGIMIVPTSISFFIFDLSDRFFLNHYRSLEEIGLYSIGINIVSLIVFFSSALSQAWSPQVMKIYFESKKIFHQFVPRFFIYYLIFFFSLATLLTLFGQEILMILTTPKYFDAAKVIGPLSIGLVFSASNKVTAMGINISRKTKYLALYTIIAAILNTILNFLLIPKYGMVGAGWATALSYLFLTTAYFINSQRFIYLAIDWQKILKLVTLSLIVISLSPMLWHYGFVLNLIVKISELFIFAALLYLLGVIEKQEITYLKKYLILFYKRARYVTKRDSSKI